MTAMTFWTWLYATFAFAYAVTIIIALRSLPLGPRRTKIVWTLSGLSIAFGIITLVKNHLLN